MFIVLFKLVSEVGGDKVLAPRKCLVIVETVTAVDIIHWNKSHDIKMVSSYSAVSWCFQSVPPVNSSTVYVLFKNGFCIIQ